MARRSSREAIAAIDARLWPAGCWHCRHHQLADWHDPGLRGAVQLPKFGAGIYVADLVGLAVAREMAAVMTAIVLAGRTGAAYAAQLGTMQAQEEIDALSAFGIPPIEFLVLPRMLALTLMMPLLYLYACLVGFAGGLVVGTGMLGLSITQFVLRHRRRCRSRNLPSASAKAPFSAFLSQSPDAFAACGQAAVLRASVTPQHPRW